MIARLMSASATSLALGLLAAGGDCAAGGLHHTNLVSNIRGLAVIDPNLSKLCATGGEPVRRVR
jgi:hypothetical protein